MRARVIAVAVVPPLLLVLPFLLDSWSLARLGRAARDFQAQSQLARSTPRISMVIPITELRKASDRIHGMIVFPTAASVKDELKAAADSDLQELVAFMAQDERYAPKSGLWEAFWRDDSMSFVERWSYHRRIAAPVPRVKEERAQELLVKIDRKRTDLAIIRGAIAPVSGRLQALLDAAKGGRLDDVAQELQNTLDAVKKAQGEVSSRNFGPSTRVAAHAVGTYLDSLASGVEQAEHLGPAAYSVVQFGDPGKADVAIALMRRAAASLAATDRFLGR